MIENNLFKKINEEETIRKDRKSIHRCGLSLSCHHARRTTITSRRNGEDGFRF